ncbi:MAG: BamA/TamA family outer membrane protein [Candidatus Amulumruptor caecigallinarius]|nr:BamA/TamA family outer membrane protein [Candidatus Amulumruptor caecigallinarius]
MKHTTRDIGRTRIRLLKVITRLAAGILVVLIMPACSTTEKIPEGEFLYNGMKIKVTPENRDEKLPAEMVSDVKKAVDAKPNNPWPLLRPYKRNPFPFGLWVYNHWSDSAGGLKGWIYRKWAREPVLVSDVRPDTRVKMIKTILNNNGYFNSSVNYQLLQKKNPKKADVAYNVEVGEPYLIDSLIYLDQPESSMCRFIDSLAQKSKYLVPGERFCVDSLSAERVRIANAMRNKGYYFFRPDYIEFLADSLITPGRIALKMSVADNTPDIAKLQYRTGQIHTTVLRRSTRNPGIPDTLQTNKGELVVYKPAKLRKNLIPSCITFREGKLLSVRDMDRTQTRLSRLGIFGNIEIQPVPADTNPENPVLDVYITCQFERPIEASLEANVTSKSNSYLGPGLIFGLTNNNLFGGAERLNVQLYGSYEWQTGSNRSSVFNSYEVGIGSSLAFPRLLAPKFIRRTNRELNWTTITLNGNLLNRPHYFQMAEVSAGISYEWNSSRRVSHSFTPFKLTYSKLLRTTHDFDSIMAENPAVALSFESQFIPEMSYTYTYDRWFEREHNNNLNFTATIKEAGNLFWCIWRAAGVEGRKELFGMPFSQFVKAQAQLVYSHRLVKYSDQWLVTRLLIGAEHAYGNSTAVPYAEQFYIGGANSIRAFAVRSLGPGSYRPPEELLNGYFDQTGTFKLEMNAEYRFPIVSVLHGAVFLDAGNIWVLKNDPSRPGGQLKANTFLKDIALGTGVGLRVDIGMMVIRADLGYGLHAPYNTGYGGYFNIKPNIKACAFHLAIGYPF